MSKADDDQFTQQTTMRHDYILASWWAGNGEVIHNLTRVLPSSTISCRNAYSLITVPSTLTPSPTLFRAFHRSSSCCRSSDDRELLTFSVIRTVTNSIINLSAIGRAWLKNGGSTKSRTRTRLKTGSEDSIQTQVCHQYSNANNRN